MRESSTELIPSITGRFSDDDEAEAKRNHALLSEIDLLFGSPMDVVSSCLRGFIKAAPGHEFICVDFASIEARVTAWLANDTKLLEAFRNDEDVYVNAAKEIYGHGEIDAKKRQIGKVAILSLGFGGGVGAFQQMAKNYGVVVSDTDAENIKTKWREKHPKIVRLWKDLEICALGAVRTKVSHSINGVPIKYYVNGSFLFCRLPSGREIAYPYPMVELKDTPWGEKKPTLTAKWVNSMTHNWERRSLWYGILTENIVQAVARDLLVAAIRACEDLGMEVVFHVHDEIVIETRSSCISVDYVIQRILDSCPDWAKEIPMSLSGWKGTRYQK